MRRRGFGVHIPRVGCIRYHHRTGKPILKRRPALVGYLFLRFKGPVNWYVLRQCQGVKGVLYVDGHPFAMSQPDVVAIIRAQRAMRYESPEVRALRRELRRSSKGRQSVENASRSAKLSGMQPGKYVTAPMTGAERVLARIEAITKKGTVKGVLLSEGHEMPVEFTDVDNLELVDGPREAA